MRQEARWVKIDPFRLAPLKTPLGASTRARKRSVTDDIDLDAYFARIGYSGSPAPTLETLRAIHALHPTAIAFENLDPLLGRQVQIDLASIQKKLIASGRGGYCYEMNGLLAGVLRALEFEVTGLSARAIFGQ